MEQPDIYSIPGFSDPVSSWLHLLGAGIFLILTPFLVRRAAGRRLYAVTLSVYAFAVVLQLALSGVFHMLPLEGQARAILQRLDHAAIFFLIVATFTPTYAILFRGPERWATLVIMWSAAIAGIVLKVVFFKDVSEILGLALYLGMGWVGLVAMIRLARRFGLRFELLLLLGNFTYTLAAVLDFHRWPTIVEGVLESHETFHVGILLAICFHWAFFYRIAGGVRKGQSATGSGAHKSFQLSRRDSSVSAPVLRDSRT